ncbi:disulfide isomerase [Aliidiomarina minuta]|uniref:Thiol:disulfide interchange protein n=1 Tax=Aliidiomarina minuta TaxID=880057 RepID=A0A432W3A9_9GAMM|nr:thiol:disulfide interchange protein DsbA/DsbL [Aliidiomarina minuta]RUO23855.1 disulfide isomerase [Aliidiomarina minuta]
MKPLFISILLLFSASAVAAIQFEENLHYKVVAEERTDDTQILEFFSFYCATCYRYQAFNQLLKNQFDGDLHKFHVEFLSPPGMQEDMVKAWATAQLLSVEAAFSREIFDRHFEQRQRTESLQDVEDAFLAIGVEAQDFQNTLNSFQTRTLSRRMLQQAERYQIRGTPTYIVNGKYQMLPQGFRNSANFFDDYLELATYLANKD